MATGNDNAHAHTHTHTTRYRKTGHTRKRHTSHDTRETRTESDIKDDCFLCMARISLNASTLSAETAAAPSGNLQRVRTTFFLVTSLSVISACQKGAQPEKALKLFEAMQQQGVVPDVITYSALINAWEKGKKPEQALELLKALALASYLRFHCWTLLR